MTGTEPAIDEHEATEAEFSDYYERALEPDAARRVEKHLGDCERCTDAYDEFRKTVEDLSGLRKLAAPRDFESTVEDTIHRRSAGRFFGRKAFGDRVPFELLAVVALILGLIVFFLIRSSDTGSLRYERKQDAPKTDPKTKEIIPQPWRN